MFDDDDDGSKRLSFGEILNGIGSRLLEFLKGLVDAKISFCSAGDGSFFFPRSSFAAIAYLLDLGDAFFLRAGRSRGFGGAGVPHTTVRSAFKANMGAGVCCGCMSSIVTSARPVRIYSSPPESHDKEQMVTTFIVF